jgi:hypothetical protein
MLSEAMRALLIALLFACWPAVAQNVVTPAPLGKEEFSIRDQIKAARAREKADEATGPKERAWDRDARGKRPWDEGRDGQK